MIAGCLIRPPGTEAMARVIAGHRAAGSLRIPAPHSRLLGALIAAVIPVAAAAQSQSGADATIALRFGTLGIGIEAAKLLSGSVGLRVGGSFLKVSTTGTGSDIDYDIAAKAHAVSALLDLFPRQRGSFHFTGGVVTNPLTVDLTGRPTGSGTFEINGHQYTTAQVGVLSGEAKFAAALPYVGLGFGTPAGKGGRVKFRFDLGAALGKPTITLQSTGAASNAQLRADLAAQQVTTQRDVRKSAKVYPNLSFGLALHL